MVQERAVLDRAVDDRAFLVRFRTRITMLAPVALLLAAWWWGPRALPLALWLGGTACVLLGIALRLWAAGCLRKQQALVCWGPFAYLRNPLYVGTLLIGVGLGLLTGRWEALALVAALMLAVYLPTVLHEERELRALFGPAYDAYCREVPRWLPRFFPGLPAVLDGDRPCWRLVRHNREHRYLLVQLAFLGAFYAVYLLK
jgi:protein-S-isoprenylcysteine O-methyltransferase Ste14